jgi:hypothetical protein
VWQQGVDVILPSGAEAGEDILEPGTDADLVVLAGGHEAGDGGGFLAAALVAKEEPILSFMPSLA